MIRASGGPLLDGRGPHAAQRRTSGVSAALQLHPAVTATGDGAFHPARSYGASWRSAGLDEDRRTGGLASQPLSLELAIHLAPLNVVPCRGKVSGGLTSREQGRVGVRVGGERSLDQTVEDQAAVA